MIKCNNNGFKNQDSVDCYINCSPNMNNVEADETDLSFTQYLRKEGFIKGNTTSTDVKSKKTVEKKTTKVTTPTTSKSNNQQTKKNNYTKNESIINEIKNYIKNLF